MWEAKDICLKRLISLGLEREKWVGDSMRVRRGVIIIELLRV